MTNLKVQAIQKQFIHAKVPVVRPGYRVRVHQKIREGEKERIQIFEGLVIALSPGHGPNKTITVRKVVEGIGVEKIFPVFSPNVAKIEIMKTFRVRRAKLNHLRESDTAANRLKTKLGLVEKDVKYSEKKGYNAAPVAVVMEEVEASTEPATEAMIEETTVITPTEEVMESTPADLQTEAVQEETPVTSEEPVKEETKADEASDEKGQTSFL